MSLKTFVIVDLVFFCIVCLLGLMPGERELNHNAEKDTVKPLFISDTSITVDTLTNPELFYKGFVGQQID